MIERGDDSGSEGVVVVERPVIGYYQPGGMEIMIVIPTQNTTSAMFTRGAGVE